MTIDLNEWHHAVHQITGDMALRFNKATATDLKRWARMLRTVAEEMEVNTHPTFPPLCAECGKYRADPPSPLCPGCEAYQAHLG